MSFNVTLSAGEFRAFGENYSLFGYKITDNGGNAHCQFSDFSEAAFRERFPTPADLWQDALSNEAFQMLSVEYTREGDLIMDPDDATVPAGDEEFMLIGFDI